MTLVRAKVHEKGEVYPYLLGACDRELRGREKSGGTYL